MKSITLNLFVLAVIGSQSVKDPDWRQITPLRSTRIEVERLLGTSSKPYSAEYSLERRKSLHRVFQCPCTPLRKGGWNVPKDVVVQMSFSPNVKKPVSSLKLDLKRFRKSIDEHVGGVIYYINDDLGLTYEIQGGKVDAIYYQPGKKDERLYCDGQNNLKHKGTTVSPSRLVPR